MAPDKSPSSLLEAEQDRIATTQKALERVEAEILTLDPEKDAKTLREKEDRRDELHSRLETLQKRARHLEAEGDRLRFRLSPKEIAAKEEQAASILRQLRSVDAALSAKARAFAAEVVEQTAKLQQLSGAAMELERQVFMAKPPSKAYFVGDWMRGSPWLSNATRSPLAAGAEVLKNL